MYYNATLWKRIGEFWPGEAGANLQAELASFRAAYQQRGILLSNALNEVRLLMAENRRLRAK
jgi:hypothetical protein